MKELINKSTWINIISSMLFGMLGLFMFFNAKSSIEWFNIFMELLLIISGISTIITYTRSDKKYEMFSYRFIYGIISIIIAVFLIINPKIVASIFPLIIGLWMTIGSLIRIKFSFTLKEDKLGVLYIAGSLLMFTCGIAIICNPFTIAIELVKVLGIVLAVYSFTDVIQSIIFKKHINSLDI